MQTASRHVFVRAALVVLSLFGTFATWECYLRLHAPVAFLAPASTEGRGAWTEIVHRRSAILGLSYELAPSRKVELPDMSIRTNSLGMRSDELRETTLDLVRIVVVGDSYAFGFGVEEHETFAVQLELLLNARAELTADARSFEVLNLGVGGYSTRDEELVLEHRALLLEPELVIVAYTLNDPELDALTPLHVAFDEPRWWQSSHALRFIARSAHRRRVSRLGGGSYIRSLYADERKWQSVLDGFAGMAEASLSASVPVLLVVFPFAVRGPTWGAYAFRDVHERVVSAARAVGFETLDLLPAFEEHPPLEVRLAQSDEHPSPLGHALAARAIMERLLDAPTLRSAVFDP